MSGRRRMLYAKSSLSITVLLVLALSDAQTSSNSFTRYCNATRTVVVNGSLIEVGCAVRQNETLCGSLQSALELVALSDQNELDCTVVEIVSGVHNLTRTVTIDSNVFIRGRGASTGVFFDLDLSEAGFSSVDPIPVLLAHHSSVFSIECVAFHGSPGFIQIHNVTEILIQDCTFR